MRDPRWPNLFVVGAPRAGTSSLWSYLDQHPQIFMSRLKEPHYLSEARPHYMPVVTDEAAYLRLFDGAHDRQLRGEASPSYLYSRRALDEIERLSPDARIVIILRDPVLRAYSDYWHRVRYGRETGSFLDQVRTQAPAPELPPSAGCVRAGLYAAPVARYLSAFGDAVLVLFLEELAADRRRELRRTFEFLGVDPAPAERLRLEVRNASALPAGAVARFVYRSPYLRSLGRRLIPDQWHARAERMLLRQRQLPPMDPEARALLEAVYAPERPELERLLGRPLAWAVDGAAVARPG